MDFGFLQEIHVISATKLHPVGMPRIDPVTGKKYRYAKAGATLLAGDATVAAQANADHVDESMAEAAAVGVSQLTLTVTAGTTIAEDNLVDGFFQVHDGGIIYGITSNTDLAVGGTSIIINLDRPIQVALTTSNEFSLFANPWMDITDASTDENFCTGVCPMAITDNYYFWSQTGGVATALINGTPAVGSNLIYSPDGSLAVVATSSDVDVPVVGYMWGSAGVDNDYGMVFLNID